MDTPFKPILPFFLGNFDGPNTFMVVPSKNSAFEGFEHHTMLPRLHLTLVVANKEMTWESWGMSGVPMYRVMSYVDANMNAVIKHFFGDKLSMEDAAWRFEMNSPNAAQRQTPHAHLLVGHKDLFGKDGFVRQCVSSALKPELLTKDTVEDAILAREQEAARTLMNCA